MEMPAIATYSLSSMQMGMVFHSLLSPRSGIYIPQIVIRFRYHLDIDILKRSWQEVVRRHDVLRTNIEWNHPSGPKQQVHDDVDIAIVEHNWRPSSETWATSLDDFLQADRENDFDLTSPPLMRFYLLRLALDDNLFVWSHHHCLLDGRSQAIVVKELILLYDAYMEGRDLALLEPAKYQEYIEWLDMQDLNASESYWRALRPSRSPIGPSSLRAPSNKVGSTSSYRTRRITPQTGFGTRLRAVAQDCGITLNTVVQGAWALLLGRHCGRTEVIFGATRACRHSSLTAAESRVGVFINTVPVIVEVDGAMRTVDYLQDLRRQNIAVRPYENTPLHMIQQWYGIRPGEHLFDSVVVFENQDLNSRVHSELQLLGHDNARCEYHLYNFTHYPLVVTGYALDELILEIAYDRSWFEESTINQISKQLQVLLNSIADKPLRLLGELSLLTLGEQHELLSLQRHRDADYQGYNSIQSMFEEQVGLRPAAEAVVFENQSLTYFELNRRANQLGHYLRKLGVGPEVRVGACISRSLEMVIAMLGIVKAGGAYLPIDPNYPAERIRLMLEDSGIEIILVHSATGSKLEGFPRILKSISLDQDWNTIGLENSTNCRVESDLQNAAYVIYTSGSTGKPKGVVVSHGNAVRLFTATQAWFGFTADDVWSLFHSYAFDFSVWELWGALSYGGRLVIVPYWVSRSPEAFYRLLQKERITVLNLTPSAFYQLAAFDEKQGTGVDELKIRLIILGGEALDSSRLRAWFTRHGDGHPQIINMYGITETTVHVTYASMIKEMAHENASVIGRAIPDLQIYIFDDYLRPVPVGVAGELYVGGAGVARGYLNRPELTAERFVPHPGDEKGARLYRTGDLARYREDMSVEYLGRIDHQVKVRGFRIEIGEIEAVLGEHKAIAHAVVIAQDDILAGSKRLVAYFVRRQQHHLLKTSELKQYMREKLPEHMVPGIFIEIKGMPLTPNGKLDRNQLPSPGEPSTIQEDGYGMPRTRTEDLLVRIWKDVLQVDRVGIHDSFFDLGGHSLLAMLAVSRIREICSSEISVRELLQYKQISALATIIDQELKEREKRQGALIPAIAQRDKLFLSYAQQGMWFLYKFEANSALYNLPLAVSLKGPLQIGIAEKALAEIVRRHEILRTSFSEEGGAPFQVVHPPRVIDIPVIDLQQLPEAERAAEAKRMTSEHVRKPFDLTCSPLIRPLLMKMGPEEHDLILVMHHIVSDGWSLGVLIREFASLYEAFSLGEISQLEELPIQYGDYAVWQRGYLQDDVIARQLEYWTGQLAAMPEALELSIGRSRPVIHDHRGAQHDFCLSVEFVNSLYGIGRGEGATLFMSLLASFKILLSRYSGQTDILVGTPIAGRNQRQTEALIGLFVNTLVLRSELSGRLSFRELLQRVRAVALNAYSNADVPFDRLVQEIQPERDASRTPLFQIMFALQSADMKRDFSGLTLQQKQVDLEMEKFDLTLVLTEGAEGLQGAISFRKDLFDLEAIRRMAVHFEVLLNAVATRPDCLIDELELLSKSERMQLLVEWNRPAGAYRWRRCVHEVIAEQAQRRGDAVAVVYRQERISYQTLNYSANQLGRYLRKLGVRAETRVGICMGRSSQMVIAMLGVLKAGGAYVPLDPDYPAERLEYIVEDANVQLILVHDATRFAIAKEGIAIISLDHERDEIDREESHDLGETAVPENTVYVIYTSGSTGRPKGVVVTHEGICNTIFGMCERFEINGVKGVLQKNSFSFDPSMWEIALAMFHGAKLVIADQEGYRDNEYLLELIIEHQITDIYLIASLLPSFLQQEDLKNATSLKRIFVGAEALSLHSVGLFLEQFHGAMRGVQLHNFYGPTEISIGCLNWIACPTEETVPIGQPIANTDVYILDELMRPVPVGLPGELYLGGAGLARGYLNRMDLTAERFVPDPFSKEGGRRLYRTGDKARYLSDGNVEFLGRIDDQIKIRGYRIEPGEIEAALHQYENVTQALTIVREDKPGDKRLVAYVVAHDGTRLDLARINTHLRKHLPQYMVPSALVQMDAIPVTANGKLDRRRLPVPSQERLQVEAGYAPPRTPIEELLERIWAEVLQVDQVGIYDNFFYLGGHSLLVTQAISRIQETFGIGFSLRQFFAEPTIAELAVRIQEELQQASPYRKAPPIAPADRTESVPLSYAQQRLWFLHEFEGASALYNIPSAVQIKGRLQAGVLEAAINEILRRHEVLRTTIKEVDGTAVQVISPPVHVHLERIAISGINTPKRERQVQHIIDKRAEEPFDLIRGPLVRFSLIEMGEQEYLFMVTMHHIICDGWSMNVVTRELATIYEAFSQGKRSPLEELKIQYADYALWQRRYLQDSTLAEQLGYWRRQLSDMPDELALPMMRARPANQSHDAASHHFRLPAELRQSFARMGRTEGVTLYMILLAVFKILLHRYSGQADIVIGSPIAGRNRREIENLIGLFVNTLVLCTNLSHNPSFQEVLKRIRDVALDAYANQDMPFEKLVEELQPERDIYRTPMFQVMFVLQNVPESKWALTGLDVEQQGIDVRSAKFDLELHVVEKADDLEAVFLYRTALFDSESIRSMADQFETLLRAVVSMRERPIHELPLLSEAQRQEILAKGRQVPAAYQYHTCVHDLFERQVQQTPDAVAVVFGEKQLTYKDLNLRANQLAYYLKTLGVGPEVSVGILLDRSIELVVALLGTMKAGGVYVPLDSHYPAERLALIIGDAEVHTILAQKSTHGALRQCDATVIDMDVDLDTMGWQATASPAFFVEPDHAAYVIYTSGSTGKPKGVVIAHRALTNHMMWMQREFVSGVADRVLQKTATSFDASVWEFFLPLISGAQLVMAGPESHRDPLELAAEILQYQITILQVTPSMLRGLVEVREFGQSKSLRLICAGGEPLDRYLVEAVTARVAAKVVNLYGPTEATIDASSWLYDYARSTERIPIGRAIANAHIYILDSEGEPCPAGIPGQLFVGGAGVGRGYLNDPALTAVRFVPDRLSATPGARLYATGDLGQYQRDGNIVLWGRMDRQVKIRGYRIEPGEVESALRRHPDVSQCVIVAWEDRLVGYIVKTEKARDLHVDDLVSFLKLYLPEYAIPSLFMELETIPLTPNGKLDWRSLPTPRHDRQKVNEAEGPQDSTEEQLIAIWKNVLCVDSVGVHDNFFELGGHSLLAMQVVFRIRKIWNVQLSLRQLFTAPNIAALAKRIKGLLREQPMTPGKLTRIARDGQLPLSFEQIGLLLAEWVRTNQKQPARPLNPSFGLVLTGLLDLDALQWALTKVAERHENLRAGFYSRSPMPALEVLPAIAQELLGRPAPDGTATSTACGIGISKLFTQVIEPRVTINIHSIDLSDYSPAQQKEDAAARVMEAISTPFDFTKPPLMRVVVLKLNQTKHLMLVVMSHLITDGPSMGLFQEELKAFYGSYPKSDINNVAELPIQYVDYACWQRERLQGDFLQKLLQDWKTQWSDCQDSLLEVGELPFALSPEKPGFKAEQEQLDLDVKLSDWFSRLCASKNITLYAGFVAALNILFFLYTRKEKITIFTSFANRLTAETAYLIGWFANLHTLTVSIRLNERLDNFLQQVQRSILSDVRQELPLTLVAASNIVDPIQQTRAAWGTRSGFIAFDMQMSGSRGFADNIAAEPMMIPSPTIEDALRIMACSHQKGISLIATYSTDRFLPDGIRQMLADMERVLNLLAVQPESHIADIVESFLSLCSPRLE